MDESKVKSFLTIAENALSELRKELFPQAITLQLKPGDDVNAAINSLNNTGGTVVLQPGYYPTNIVLQQRDISRVIVVRSATTRSSIPNKSSKSNLAILASPNTESTVKAKLFSGGVTFNSIAFDAITPDRTLVDLGGDKVELKDRISRPSNFIFNYCLFLGSETKGQHRGIQCNAKNVRISYCAFYDFFEFNRDSQAICGWNGSEDVIIDSCYAEAGAENIMFGGGDCASIDMIPRNIKILYTTFSKNINWMKLSRSNEINIKALFELKNVIGFYMNGCLLENNWAKDWPSGVGMTLKSCNQEGENLWATMEDVLIENTVIRNVGTVLNVVGQNDSGHLSVRAKNVRLRNILAYNINKAPYLGDMRMLMTNTPHDFSMENSTILDADHAILTFSLDPNIEKPANFMFNNNVMWHGEYGVFSSFGLGTAALENQLSSYIFMHNIFRRNALRQNFLPVTNRIVPEAEFDSSINSNFSYTSKDGIQRGITTQMSNLL